MDLPRKAVMERPCLDVDDQNEDNEVCIDMIKSNTDDVTEEYCARNRNSSGCLKKIRKFLQKNLLVFLSAIGVCIGFVLGFCIRLTDPSDNAIMWIGLPGEMFMRMLKITILPLITGTLIKGAYSSDPKANRRLTLLIFVFVIASNAIGTLVGISFFYIFNPGSDVTFQSVNGNRPDTNNLQTGDMFADLIRNFLPDNVVSAAIEKTQTRYKKTYVELQNANISNVTEIVYQRYVGTASGTNVLGLVIVCTIVGLAASKLGESVKDVVALFENISKIFQKILGWVIWFTPIGVTSLIASSIASANDLESAFVSIGKFVLAFTLAILFLSMVVIPVVIFVSMRKNPFTFMLSMGRVLMTGFAPPSAMIVIPDMIRLVENKYNIEPSTAAFAVPCVAVTCRCGSTVFICMTSLFLVNLEGIDVTYETILIGILTVFGALAVPAMPSGSIVAIILIMSSLNIDSSYIGIIMAIEWYTDRLRTTVNIISIVTITAVVDHLLTKRFPKGDSTTPSDHVAIGFNEVNANKVME